MLRENSAFVGFDRLLAGGTRAANARNRQALRVD